MQYLYEEEETKFSPSITLDPGKGYIEFRGKVIPENPSKLFDPVYEWFEVYMQDPCALTKVEFRIEYLNSASSKHVLNILERIKKISEGESDVTIYWFYDPDDDGMMDVGYDYADYMDMDIICLPNPA